MFELLSAYGFTVCVAYLALALLRFEEGLAVALALVWPYSLLALSLDEVLP